MSRSLTDWVDYIQTLHARTMDLSLERVAEVYQRLYPDGVHYPVITIAGTNGKGSTAELLASIYRQAGLRVGKYTSPHLVSVTERYNIQGQPVAETLLINAFERIEEVRGEVSLTFFEFGTLLAIDLFAHADLDVAVMEVGLGGRLDAVNILDPELTIITSIALDHTAWLGDSLEQILVEKFGVTRKGIPCVIGMQSPPENLPLLAEERGVPLIRLQQDFRYKFVANADSESQAWDYLSDGWTASGLPLPFGQGGHQLDNAAAALTAVRALQTRLPVNDDNLREGIQQAYNPARCEVKQRDPYIIVDVAHNPASVEALARFILSLEVMGRIVAVCGMLQDKDISHALSHIAPQIDTWYVATIHDERGAKAEQISAVVEQMDAKKSAADVLQFDSVGEAFERAENQLQRDDCLVVFGSFFISGDIIAQLQKRDDHG